VCGDEDLSPHFTESGPEWHSDPYLLAQAPKDMLMLKGGNHVLGGISGWDARETVDESPERVAVLQRMTWAYLRSQFYEGDAAWAEACKALKKHEGLGSVESKSK
jgi:hypothetical protein